jgi:uncharacterized membrane protein YebE (DUF533 family)
MRNNCGTWEKWAARLSGFKPRLTLNGRGHQTHGEAVVQTGATAALGKLCFSVWREHRCDQRKAEQEHQRDCKKPSHTTAAYHRVSLEKN